MGWDKKMGRGGMTRVRNLDEGTFLALLPVGQTEVNKARREGVWSIRRRSANQTSKACDAMQWQCGAMRCDAMRCIRICVDDQAGYMIYNTRAYLST